MVTGGLVWFILMFCTYIMARDRHRDEFGWILFGLIGIPCRICCWPSDIRRQSRLPKRLLSMASLEALLICKI